MKSLLFMVLQLQPIHLDVPIQAHVTTILMRPPMMDRAGRLMNFVNVLMDKALKQAVMMCVIAD